MLYSFCAHLVVHNCTDGWSPDAGLIMDKAGQLLGTTYQGGAHTGPFKGGGGTVFALTPNAAKTEWTETVLYSFCAQERCTDGWNPDAGLIMDKAGHLYGTTFEGGAHEYGTVFALTPNAAKTTWTETVLYSFCAQERCTDGESPDAGLILDKAGHLYGTTLRGGAHHENGTVFELP